MAQNEKDAQMARQHTLFDCYLIAGDRDDVGNCGGLQIES